MKVFVKKNNRLLNIGEGSIISKKDLFLKESGVVAAVPNAKNVRQFVNQGAKTFHQSGNVGLVQGEMGQFDNQQDASTGEGLSVSLPVNATGSQIAKVQTLANQQGNDDMKINLTPPTTGSSDSSSSLETSSVFPRKTIDEIRMESVPFSKRELSEFLRSI